jgi:formylglycine-generating enzyme required for sulfatase activity
MRFRGWAALAAAGLLSACGKPAPTPPVNSATGAEANPGGVVEIVTKSGVAMVALPGGEFTMGSDQGNADEAPPHKVKVSAFLMDKFEVTHELFKQAQLPNPSHWQENAKNPVERVRWNDAKQYCNERSLLEGLKPCYNEKTPDWDCDYSANGYRLPTEAEWEYACRAGTGGPFDFGAADKLRQYAWVGENAGEKTHPVGQKKANRWGIHDLYGNVSEWCEDVYDPGYYQQSPAADPTGPPNPGKDVKRVMRGGSWKTSADLSRATVRQGQRTGDTDACFFTDYCGFRCVRRASPEEIKALSAK